MTALSIPTLRETLAGRVIAPGDDGYDQARTVFYGGIDRHPAVIARPANAADAARVVTLARETGLDLAVRSGGHGVAGHGVCDDGIVLDLSEMKALEIDVAELSAWAETGLTAIEYTSAAAEHGLATGFGDTGSVGIGGITLAGGVGYLARKHGLTIDDVLAAEVVAANGDLLRVDEGSHPDLFWAIRGGGGNLGVATRFRYRLHELGNVVGGILVLPATAETIEGFLAEAAAAPEELGTIANVMSAPPMPFLPEELHGRIVLMGLMCFAGDVEAGQRALAPFRALAEPLADLVRPIPYPEIYPPEDASLHPVASARTMFVDEVDRAGIDTMLERLEASTAMMRAVQLRVLGGAMARVPNDATAFAHRDRALMLNVAALYGSPDERETHGPWVDALADSLQRGPIGAYSGFLGDEGEARVHDAYPKPTWDRFAEIKARYDPTNLFHLNQNVPPAT
jgi:FAD/FMN-containing dehydrogenase